MERMSKLLLKTLVKLDKKSKELVTKLKKITPAMEDNDECKLFCNLEDLEQEIDSTIDTMDETIKLLKEISLDEKSSKSIL